MLPRSIGTGVPRAGNVDGMECDEQGNVWVTGTGGVWVISPEGERLGIVNDARRSRAASAGAATICTRCS